uniref:Uncharacterized protein n=1 Tax=Esox lucius TaxID=8010 RepID=A0A6Q2ZNK7_ESOLU
MSNLLNRRRKNSRFLLYDKEKDEDGFLYVAYSGENTFGI